LDDPEVRKSGYARIGRIADMKSTTSTEHLGLEVLEVYFAIDS